MKRESYDPQQAVVAEILCPECCDETGAMEPPTFYRDAEGRDVPWTEGEVTP